MKSPLFLALVVLAGALGFLGMLIPESHGGLGLDSLSYLLALEEIAQADASAAVLLSVHNSLPTQMLLRFGNEAQRARFLAPMAQGTLLGAFALSEPEAGSDASALRTQAVRDGDHYILNGTKAWVTNGGTAGVIMAMARTDTPEDRRGDWAAYPASGVPALAPGAPYRVEALAGDRVVASALFSIDPSLDVADTLANRVVPPVAP